MLTESPAEFGKRALALLVGISRFENESFRDRPLPFAENDVHDFKELLCAKLGWNGDRCLVLKGKIAKPELMEAFNSQIAAARSMGNTSLFLFYISTHGQLFDGEDGSETGVLLTSDTNVTNLPTAMETGITNQFLSGFMRETRSTQKLVISDACFAGSAASAQGATPLSYYKPVDAAILASSRFESFAPPDARNSLFTAALMSVLQKVRGAATLPTVFEPVWRTVREEASRLGKDQEPLLSHQGGVIVLGYLGPITAPVHSFSFADIQQSSTALLQSQLDRHAQDGAVSDNRYIARRQTEDFFWDYLSQSHSPPAFTIVGSAGAGKSTTMQHLAMQAARRGHLVLWLPGDTAELSDPLTWINRSIERLAGSLTLQETMAATPADRRLLVFFDAVNEWQDIPSKIVESLTRAVNAARKHSFRLVVSCRDTAWADLSAPFLGGNAAVQRDAPTSTNGVSSQLTAFTEDELQRARELYGGIERFASLNIARQPLFVRVVSELTKAGSIESDQLSLLDVLDEYLRIRVEKIARRILTAPTEVTKAIDHIIREMDSSHAESLPRAKFFSGLPEPVAVSLLDEGLFKYAGEEITVEADIVQEHLLSRVLPNDMFETSERFQAIIRSSRLAPGAMLLRLSSISNRNLVLRALHWIDANSPFDVLDALDGLPALGPYWDFFGPWFVEHAGFDQLIADRLVRRIDSEIEFCVKAAKAMFVNENYFPWEWKRWRDVTWLDFRKQVAAMRGAPELLAQCAERQPAYTVSVLASDWLTDSTRLRHSSGQASIGIAAQIYLSAMGQRFPDIVFAALDSLMTSQPDAEKAINPILQQLCHAMPREMATYAALWARNLAGAALTVITELPLEMDANALPLAKHVIRLHPGESNLIESVIAAAARFGTREGLDLIVQWKDDPTLIRGLIVALTRLHQKFPDDCEALGEELCSRPGLTDDALGYACSFYGIVSARSSDLALRFFRRAAALGRPDVGRSISFEMVRLAKSAPPALHDFIEERVRLESDSTSLFNYAIAVDQYRTLRVDDFDWLKRWIAFPFFNEAKFVIEALAKSPVPLPQAADIVFLMEKRRISLEAPKASSRLRALAAQLVNDNRFKSFRPGMKRLWQLIALGRDPEEAQREVLEGFRRSRGNK